MPNDQDRLAVRSHDRRSCDLTGRLRVPAPHDTQIMFSAAVAEADGSLPFRVVDCSEGGLGLRVPVYLPRGALLDAEVRLGPGENAARHLVRLRVQRTSMVDRSPAYYLGTSLVDPAASRGAIRDLLAIAEGQRPGAGASGAAA